jgi:uncharacterized membrane protein YfcA
LEYWAQFPGGAYHVNIIELISLGFTVGIMTGFWGMGGRFVMTPLLNVFFNIPYNVAVGSDICQMVGTSSMNMVKFKIMGTVDYKLACWMIMGAIGGVECGAQMLEFLKSANDLILMGKPLKILFLVLSAIYAALLFWIGTLVYGESKAAYERPKEMGNLTDFQLDVTARLQTLRLPPMISLPVSGIQAVSFWVILGVGFLTGLLVGFLGVGGSFIVLPALIYILGCPMGVAMSTDLFASLLVMGYGTFSHSLKGNIDLILVIVLFLSSTLGMQVGNFGIKKFRGSKVRRGFALIAYSTVLFLALKISSTLGLVSFPF